MKNCKWCSIVKFWPNATSPPIRLENRIRKKHVDVGGLSHYGALTTNKYIKAVIGE